MPLQATHPLTVASGNYKDQLLAELRISEDFREKPYNDSVNIATIGWGFNIETVSAYMALTLNQLGILGNKTAAETQQILNQFIVAATPATSDSDLQFRLNQQAQQYGVTEFKISEPQARAIYDQILEGGTIGVTSGSPLVIPGKQAHLDTILGNSLAHNTLEYVALMSMFYNAESLVGSGSKLATAVINDDRAEAWYQIRYGSNADGQHTARRIDESKLFSLYDNPGQGVSEAEAKEVLRMYTIHQREIQDYESRFAVQFPTGGTDTVVSQIIGAKTTLIPIYNAGKANEAPRSKLRGITELRKV